MNCPSCGAKNGPTALFCTQCGVPLIIQIVSMANQTNMEVKKSTDWASMIMKTLVFLTNIFLQIAMGALHILADVIDAIL